MSTANTKPIGDRVILKQDGEPEKTHAGIFIPEPAKEKPKTGIIISVGNCNHVKIGDHVIFGKSSGTEIMIDGESYLILRESDLYAILNP